MRALKAASSAMNLIFEAVDAIPIILSFWLGSDLRRV